MKPNKYTKKEIVQEITLRLPSLSENTIKKVVNEFLLVTRQTLSKHINIELRDFGSFELRTRKARKNARNPKTGTSVHIPQHTVVTFRSGKKLKNDVWGTSIPDDDAS